MARESVQEFLGVVKPGHFLSEVRTHIIRRNSNFLDKFYSTIYNRNDILQIVTSKVVVLAAVVEGLQLRGAEIH